jgi:hypothetical protein
VREKIIDERKRRWKGGKRKEGERCKIMHALACGRTRKLSNGQSETANMKRKVQVMEVA